MTLREPSDRRARSQDLTRRVAENVKGRGAARVLDLATGTGSNARYLMPHLGAAQSWCTVDRDPDLLAVLPQRVASWAIGCGLTVRGDPTGFSVCGSEMDCRLETRVADLSILDADLFRDRTLVTASALLDLVSERWLDELVDHCARSRASILFALTYDGRITCAPSDSDDAFIRELVNRHQRSAKGFGDALGPDAAACALRAIERAGYYVESAPSDWLLTPSLAGLQQQLIEGWAGAAVELEPGSALRIEGWKMRRLEHLAAGRSTLVVGHQDLIAWPQAVAGG